MRDVISLAKLIQDRLPVDVTELKKAQRHNGKPCAVDVKVYHGNRSFLIRVVEPDKLPVDDE